MTMNKVCQNTLLLGKRAPVANSGGCRDYRAECFTAVISHMRPSKTFFFFSKLNLGGRQLNVSMTIVLFTW